MTSQAIQPALCGRFFNEVMMLRTIIAAAIIALLATAVQAAGLYPLSNMQQLDNNGKIMPGARLFLYDGGTSTPRIGYKDSSLTSPHPNPILADAAGRLPLIYIADGFFRHRLTTKAGTLIFDQDGIPVVSTTSEGSGTSVDPDSVFKTRDIKIRFDDQPLSGYVRLNGRTIGSASSGATERANADTQSLYEELWGFSNISVSGGKGASAAADFAANKPLVLPNAAGRGLFGMDDLGAGAQSVLTGTYCTGPTLPGATCGAQTVTIAASNLPTSSPWLATAFVTVTGATDFQGNHFHTGTTDAADIPPHDHSYNEASNQNMQVQSGVGQGQIWGQGASAHTSGGSNQSSSHSHTFTTVATGSHSHTVVATGTPTVTMQSNAGGGQATNKLPPLMTLMIFIRL